MADLQSLQSLAPQAAPSAPVHVQKLDKQGRAYATGKRKNAMARVWLSRGAGRIMPINRGARSLIRELWPRWIDRPGRQQHVECSRTAVHLPRRHVCQYRPYSPQHAAHCAFQNGTPVA